MEVIQHIKGARMTDDTRSRRYKISRTRNILIKVHDALGEYCLLPEDFMGVNLALCRVYEIIGEIICLLQAAQQQPRIKKAAAVANIASSKIDEAMALLGEYREFGDAPAPAAPDPLADLVFSQILDREAELVALTEAGRPMQEELAAVRALLRLVLSPNVRMPLSRLH